MHKYFLIMDLAIGAVVWRLNDRIKDPLIRAVIVLTVSLCIISALVNLTLAICLD